MLQLSKVEAIQTELECIGAETIKSQSIQELIELGANIVGWMAFTGQQMAIASKEYNEAKSRSYMGLEMSMKANGMKFTPMLAKDFINSKCSKELYAYEFTERVNRSCTHSLDFIRTAISALKAELTSITFSPK
jgi:hypothetical protein